MAGFAATAQADWAATGGEIGLVNTNVPNSNVTNGATLVTPGSPAQALGDIRLLIPNTFKNGDIIDLTIFDRTATVSNAGTINADTAHRLGFTAATTSVNPNPYVSTHLGPVSTSANSIDGSANNAAVIDTAAGHGTQPPVFTTTLAASSRANGLSTDIIRLTVNGVQAAGSTATDDYVVTVSGITANVGASVSPGELRVVPFAYNAQPSGPALPSQLFGGNTPPNSGFNPVINTYTVPAYVSPVNFTVGAPNNITADNTTQGVGDITIAETNPYSLQAGNYSVGVGGATIENGVGSNPAVTVTATNPATGETVTSPATVAANALNFTLAQTNVLAANQDKVTITLSGLLLSTGVKGPITYRLQGGSIDANANASFFVTGGTSLAVGSPAPDGVAADSAFLTLGGSINQQDIAAPALVVNAAAIPVVGRIGGSDRYDTAAKIAASNGSNKFVVLASGENFPDAVSSAYLAHQLAGASILLTQQNSLPAVSADAMRLLGTETVVIVGGTNAISAGVEAQLKATPQWLPGGQKTLGQGLLQVIRLGGADRYATNRLANEYAAAYDGNIVGRTAITFGKPSKLTALVATGENYVDALSAGPATRATGGPGLPLILTSSSSLSPDASSQLTDLGIEQAVITGGTAAVSSGVESSISGLGVAIDRLAGANRYGTATAVADFERAPALPTVTKSGGLGFTGDIAYLATGWNFADALAGAPLAGGKGSSILLTDPTTLSPETQTWLVTNAAPLDQVVAFGLAGAVSNSTLAAANAAIGH